MYLSICEQPLLYYCLNYILNIFQSFFCWKINKTYIILLQFSSTSENWKHIADNFGLKLWNYVSVIDGRYIIIIKPIHFESTYFNYKRFFIILLVIVNANEEFIIVDCILMIEYQKEMYFFILNLEDFSNKIL